MKSPSSFYSSLQSWFSTPEPKHDDGSENHQTFDVLGKDFRKTLNAQSGTYNDYRRDPVGLALDEVILDEALLPAQVDRYGKRVMREQFSSLYNAGGDRLYRSLLFHGDRSKKAHMQLAASLDLMRKTSQTKETQSAVGR